jgi:small subunit ribosomal protein S2
MYYVNHRWLGGLLTNNATIQKSIQRLRELDEMSKDGRYELLTKKEVLRLERERKHLEQNLAGIRDMPGLPDALFVVDSHSEEIAVQEARKLGIPVVAIVDTNCDPDLVNHVIPGNDDALRAIRLFTSRIADSILEGRQAAEDKRLEEEKVAAEKAAEELEQQRMREAIAAGEIPPPEYQAGEQEFAVEGEVGISPTILAAEEVLDGRVRSPRLKRKPGGGGGDIRPRGRGASDVQ